MAYGILFTEQGGELRWAKENAVFPSRTIVTTDQTQTLTNKTLTSPTISGSPTITGATLTSPTIAAGALSGTFTGTPTFSGAVIMSGSPVLTTPAITSPSITTSLIFNESTADLTVTADDQGAAATLNLPNLNGVNAGAVVSTALKLDATDGHDSAAGTSTATVELPAGSVLLNIQVVTTVLWDSGTSATLTVGDDDTADGWFTGVNVKATDLLVGEVLDISNAENWGGVNGAYLVAATGRKGRTTVGVDSGIYLGAATEVIAAITSVGATTVGTTYVIVTWMKPTEVAATYAAT